MKNAIIIDKSVLP